MPTSKVIFVLEDGTMIKSKAEIDNLSPSRQKALENYRQTFDSILRQQSNADNKSLIIYENGHHVIV